MLDFKQIFEDAIFELESATVLDESLSGTESTKLRNLMKKNVVKFHYKKKDGSERTAEGTLKKDLMPKFKTEKKPTYNPLRFIYWDVEKNAFRSFLRANFISYDKPEKEKPAESAPSQDEKENKAGNH